MLLVDAGVEDRDVDVDAQVVLAVDADVRVGGREDPVDPRRDQLRGLLDLEVELDVLHAAIVAKAVQPSLGHRTGEAMQRVLGELLKWRAELQANNRNPLFAVPLAPLILFIIGWALYRLVVFRVVDRDLFVSLLATFGLSILLQQLMNTVFTGDIWTAESDLGTSLLFGGLVSISNVKIVAFFLAILLGVCLMTFLRYSRLGQAIRATAQNPRAARVLGIDTDKLYAITFGLNAAICGACGALVAMTYNIHPYIGRPYTIRAFMIVIVAGLGNLAGVVLAGLGLGAAENIAGFVLGAEFQLAFVFGLLVVVLVWRNTRLAAKRQYLK